MLEEKEEELPLGVGGNKSEELLLFITCMFAALKCRIESLILDIGSHAPVCGASLWAGDLDPPLWSSF